MSYVTITLKVMIYIFVVEGIIMLSFSLLPQGFQDFVGQEFWILPLIDVILLTIFSGPIIYIWAIRPFVLASKKSALMVEERNKNLLEAQRIGKIGSWEYDVRNDNLVWSDEAFRIFEAKDMNGAELYNFFMDSIHANDKEVVNKAYSDSLKDRAPYSVIHRIVTPSGVVKYLHERAVTLYDESGDPVRSLGTVQDITEQKAAEKAKSEFISVVSHELRTPLTSIKGALGLVKSGKMGDFPESTKRVIDIAFRNSERLSNLINDILDLEKIDSGLVSLKLRPMDLNLLLLSAVEAYRSYGLEFDVTFRVTVSDAPVMIEGDSDRLMQVMANLLSNAAKFSFKGGQVEISVSQNGSRATIEVKDHGSGIPEAAQATIFDKFTQAEAAGQRTRGGTGLGLSIVKSITERHNGKVHFVSSEGTGTTFFIDLPMQDFAGLT